MWPFYHTSVAFRVEDMTGFLSIVTTRFGGPLALAVCNLDIFRVVLFHFCSLVSVQSFPIKLGPESWSTQVDFYSAPVSKILIPHRHMTLGACKVLIGPYGGKRRETSAACHHRPTID